MSLSEVGIWNLALVKLKEGPYASTTVNAPVVENMNTIYIPKRKEILRAHDWNFAIKRAILTPSLPAPVFGWENAFSLPTDYVRLLSIYTSDTTGTTGSSDDDPLTSEDYAFESRKILANTDALYLRYIYDNEDTNAYDSMFVAAFATLLASGIAFSVLGNASFSEKLYQQYLTELPEAERIDSKERPPKVIRRSNVMDARRGRNGIGSKRLGY